MLDVKMKSTLSPCEDNSVAAFTMHPSTRTTRTCRKREASTGRQRKNRTREEREKGMKEIHESGEALGECVGVYLDARTQCMLCGYRRGGGCV